MGRGGPGGSIAQRKHLQHLHFSPSCPGFDSWHSRRFISLWVRIPVSRHKVVGKINPSRAIQHIILELSARIGNVASNKKDLFLSKMYYFNVAEIHRGCSSRGHYVFS